MIKGVRGRIQRIESGGVVLAVGPIDLGVLVPSPTASDLAPGQDVELRTHLHVREDQLALYGFRSYEELEIFELLLSVSGVGPRMALAVISALDPAGVRRAILSRDTQALSRAPGVGLRAASRIVTDLQGKVAPSAVESEMGDLHVSSSVLTALVGMGYSTAEAKRAIDMVSADGPVEDVLRAALGALADR